MLEQLTKLRKMVYLLDYWSIMKNIKEYERAVRNRVVDFVIPRMRKGAVAHD